MNWTQPIAAVLMILAAVALLLAARWWLSQNPIAEPTTTTVEPLEPPKSCIFCPLPATHHSVLTDQLSVYKNPLIRYWNQIHEMPWLYSITEDVGNDKCLCSMHHEQAVLTLRNFHSRLRAEQANFNAEQHQKLLLMRQGGLFQAMREESAAITRSLLVLDSSSSRSIGTSNLLVAPISSDHHVLPVSTTAKGEQ